jgi:hypothetical protein
VAHVRGKHYWSGSSSTARSVYHGSRVHTFYTCPLPSGMAIPGGGVTHAKAAATDAHPTACPTSPSRRRAKPRCWSHLRRGSDAEESTGEHWYNGFQNGQTAENGTGKRTPPHVSLPKYVRHTCPYYVSCCNPLAERVYLDTIVTHISCSSATPTMLSSCASDREIGRGVATLDGWGGGELQSCMR